MPRSDRSSDPDDGSITSDGSNDPPHPAAPPEHGHALRVDTKPTASTPHDTAGAPESPGSGRAPSIWQEALEMIDEPAVPGVRRPNERFKAAVRKVIGMNRMRVMATDIDEPGVDPRRPYNAALYDGIRAQCSIEVIDYGATNFRSTRLDNAGLEKFIAHDSGTRPLWSKVRWINIGGVSWDVIKALALRYNMHPLSIEDTLLNKQSYSSKADYYSKHLFIRILCHTLAEEEHLVQVPMTRASTLSTAPPTYTSQEYYTAPPEQDIKFQSRSRSSTPHGPPRQMTAPVTKNEKIGILENAGHHTQAVGDIEAQPKTPVPNLPSSQAPRPSATLLTVNALKGERVHVNLNNLFIVMFWDGTLITIHEKPGSGIFDPIALRVRQRDTLLRNTSDASMLLHNIMDLVVNHAVSVVEKYQREIHHFERDILIRPKMSTVRSLHVASGDIATLKRTLDPIKTLIYGLRRYDRDRCIATANPHAPGYDPTKIEGFLSHKTKIYLADVMDHVDYIMASLDLFGTVVENLINYAFNTVSYEMNTTMSTLTIMTVIFFPLTFFTGYFGMNFNVMPSVQTHNESFFWAIATPITALAIALAILPYITKMVHYVKKRKLQDRIRALMD